MIDNNWIFIFLGLASILAELLLGVSTGFDLVLVGTSLIVGGLVGRALSNWPVGLLVFVALTLLYILLGRRLIRNKLTVATQSTNVDRLLGRSGLVVKQLGVGQSGLVKIDAEVWRAEAEEELLLDTRIKVVAVEGVTLKVVKL